MSRRIIIISNAESDALEFISNWQISTGVSMPTTQQLAVVDLYKGLKGIGTPNGTDFWTDAVAYGAVLFPLIPLDDSTANADAYKLDAISKGAYTGTYINFVSGDFQSTGVTGGSTKRFNPSKSIEDYMTANSEQSWGVYSRTNVVSSISVGENSRNYIVHQATTTTAQWRHGSTTQHSTTYANGENGRGLVGTFTTLSAKRMFYSTSFGTNINYTFTASTASGTLFHAYNATTPSNYTTHELCCYFMGFPAINTAAKLTDFYTIIQRLQSNVITGGRQYGASIPPI